MKSLALLVALWLGASVSWADNPLTAQALLDDQSAQAHLESMEVSGTTRDPYWSNAFFLRAQEAPNLAARTSDLRWAVAFDPEFFAARRALVWTLARQGNPEFATHIFQMLIQSWESFSVQHRLLRNALMVFVLMGIAAATFLTFVAAFRTAPRLHHGLVEKLHFLPPDMRAGCSVLTIASPFALAVTLPPSSAILWALIFAVAGTWTFLGAGERRLAVTTAVLWLLTPTFLAVDSRLNAPSGAHSYLGSLWSAQSTSLRNSQWDAIQAPPAVATHDADYYATVSLQHRRRGDFATASAWLDRAIQMEPSNWVHLNNLGNLQLLSGHVDAAIATYERGSRMAPREPLLFVNLAQAWVQKLEFKQADDSFQQAVALGYHLPLRKSDDPEAIFVHDQTLVVGDLWNRFADQRYADGSIPWSRIPAMMVAMLVPLQPWPVSLLLILVAAYLAMGSRSFPDTVTCDTCGVLVCRKCHYRQHRKSFCASCYVIRQEVRAPLKREEMLQDRRVSVHRVPKAAGIVVSLLIPGTGQWIHGSPKSAALVLMATIGAVIWGAQALLWPNTDPRLASPSWISTIIPPIALVAFLAWQSVRAFLAPRPTPELAEEPARPPSRKA